MERRDCHQSGKNFLKNTSRILAMFFWRLLKPVNKTRELKGGKYYGANVIIN